MPEKKQLRKGITSGWTSSPDQKKVAERAGDRAKKASEARNKIGQVAALAARADQKRAAADLNLQQMGFNSSLLELVTKAAVANKENAVKSGQARDRAKGGKSTGRIGRDARYLAKSNNVNQLFRRIEKIGYDVNEHPDFGGVDPVHTEGSLHYSALAGDITGDRLKRLWRILRRAYNKHGLPIDEAFFRDKFLGEGETAVPGHDRHVHLGLLDQTW